MEFGAFYKKENPKKPTICKYKSRIDTYGCGCQYDCSYCTAKSLLSFRNLWNPENPKITSIEKINHRLRLISEDETKKNKIINIGVMSDCLQPLERKEKVTYETIKLLNKYGIGYLIVTKSDLIADYIDILDPKLAHIQISISFLRNEKGEFTADRIKAIELLQKERLDISVRLSPFVPQFVDFQVLNNIKCDKILVEFLKAGWFIKKNFPINYDRYTLYSGSYHYLPLEDKIKHLQRITGFKEMSVCEDVPEHFDYWKNNFNFNPDDCCNLKICT